MGEGVIKGNPPSRVTPTQKLAFLGREGTRQVSIVLSNRHLPCPYRSLHRSVEIVRRTIRWRLLKMHWETEGTQQSAKLYFHIDTSRVSIIALLSPGEHGGVGGGVTKGIRTKRDFLREIIRKSDKWQKKGVARSARLDWSELDRARGQSSKSRTTDTISITTPRANDFWSDNAVDYLIKSKTFYL